MNVVFAVDSIGNCWSLVYLDTVKCSIQMYQHQFHSFGCVLNQRFEVFCSCNADILKKFQAILCSLQCKLRRSEELIKRTGQQQFKN
jgi:ferredoxin-fold anticodon binding domain-containing protein